MKKIVFLILLFAAVALALYVTSRVNPSLFSEIKILGALLNATIFGVALIALAIGEKDVVRFPFLTASLLALFSGLVEGALLFENRYYIAITAVAFVAFVFYLQIRHNRFSNKAYKNSVDKGSKNLDGSESENSKESGEISNSQSEDKILNSSGDLSENFASGADENSDENFKILNGGANENFAPDARRDR